MAKRRKVAKPAPSKAPPKELVFDYIKSNLFRVIPVDGAFGGLSPNGREIRMALFNERRPIPQKTIHPLAADGTLIAEQREKREGRTAFVREVEVDVVLDLPTAMNLSIWLQDKIEQMAKIHGLSIVKDPGNTGKLTLIPATSTPSTNPALVPPKAKSGNTLKAIETLPRVGNKRIGHV